MAMPMSAAARAGASLIPSPTMATTAPRVAQPVAMAVGFFRRQNLRLDVVDAVLGGDGARRRLVVPGQHDGAQSHCLQALHRLAVHPA